MALIEPNSIIYLCKGVPLDNTFQHTIYWDSLAYQKAYFREKAKYVLDHQSYQRVVRGKMRVQKSADSVYDCNYLCFQNTAFGEKWFYAFITGVEYINNVTCEITFEIDPIQTYWFNPDGSLCTRLKACFVEREHSATDEIGDNLLPENLELGDYEADRYFTFRSDQANLNEMVIVVAAPFDENYQPFGGGFYSNIYNGVCFHVFPADQNGALACSNFIRNAQGQQSEVVAVFMMPKAFVTDPFNNAPDPGSSCAPKEYDFKFAKFHSVVKHTDGSAPRNNKLLTYPYNFLYVSNMQGDSAEYHYEYFNDETDTEHCTFTVMGDMSCNPSVCAIPRDYKGLGLNFDEKITLSGFPQCSFNIDTFKEWLAQNGVSIGLSVLGTAIGTTLGVVGAGAIEDASKKLLSQLGSIHGGASSIASILGQGAQKLASPTQSKGAIGGSALMAFRQLTFMIIPKHIRPEYVDIIDGYFDMFGYATHKVKVPNRYVRAEWTYTKTRNCVLECDAPADDVKKICDIYDAGITFWYEPNHVGDYSLPNPPFVG